MNRLARMGPIFLIILSFILSTQVTLVFSQEQGRLPAGTEPDGFRGIKWGQHISTLSQMVYKGPHFSMDFYIRQGDDIRIGGVDAFGIYYGFLKGKFIEARIMVQGIERFSVLKISNTAKFGEPKKLPNMEYYVWGGKEVLMDLEYKEGIGQLRIVNLPLFAEMMGKERGKGY